MTVKIGLDAGHGLHTAGKRTPTGIHEWELNDKVRDLVVEYLKPYDVEFIFTDRNEGETDEKLAVRLATYLNAGVKAFVSIHHNAYTSQWNNATGVEVFTDINYTEADMRLAKAIYKNLPKYTGLNGRGIKHEDWWVINQNRIPAVLVEGGFMDSRIDYSVITSTKGQEGYARAVAEGLIEFLGLKKTNNTPTNNTTDTKVNVYYKVKTRDYGWLPEVKNLTDYAGWKNSPITDINIRVDKGSIKYTTHKTAKGYIDTITVYYYTPSNIRPFKKAKYRVNNYPWQYDNETGKNPQGIKQDGYAGVLGLPMTRFEIEIV